MSKVELKNQSLGMDTIIWTSDLHLNAVDEEQRDAFFSALARAPGLSIVISGDIGDGKAFYRHVLEIQEKTNKRLFFVLGNHDYYGYSIDIIRSLARTIHKENENVHYLGNKSIIPLSEEVALIGHDGWADAFDGSFKQSNVVLRDWTHIQDFKGLEIVEIEEKLNELGQEAAMEVEQVLTGALEHYSKVILLTHVPPFRDVCLFEGKVIDDLSACHFVCKSMGDMLKRVFQKHPNKQCLVLSGHTHQGAYKQILPNLSARVFNRKDDMPLFEGVLLTDLI
jgi:3',5'-cyclic-AMP phosphodiesterase